ncbi:MAG: CDP-glycerol glycerophosphotransferase family protein [Patescibacteria group bacterium]
MQILRNIKAIIRSILAWIIYGLSFLVPKDKKLWIVMGWRKNKQGELFGDNAKYFFLYASQNLKDIKVIWLGQDNRICQRLKEHNYLAYNLNSLKGIWASMRAGYTIVDANIRLENWQYSGGSRLVQLWHGKSLKKMGHNSPYAMGKYRKFLAPNLFRKFYLLTAASKFLGDFNVSGFRMKSEDLLVSGLPRYDILFSDIKDSDIDVDKDFEEKLKELKAKNYNKIIFYAPTFRPDGSNPLAGADLVALDKVLEQQNDYCLVSLHPKFATKDWQPDEKFHNLEFVNTGSDLYPLMKYFDLLITDYSSLALDFLLVKVPAILYIYDLESFKAGMGLHKEIVEATPGPRVATFPDLLEVLKGDSYIWSSEHDKARDLFFSYQDAHSAKRIADELISVMDVSGQTIAESKKFLTAK